SGCRLAGACLAVFLLSTWATFAADPAIDVKLPVPSKDDQKKTFKLVAEIYRSDLDAATRPPELATLGRKLLADAKDTNDDVVGRYVLLCVARDTALKAADAATALEAVDVLGAD